MQIRWNNLIAFAIAVIGLIIFFKTPDELWSFVGSMELITEGSTDEEWTKGLIAFGLCLACVLTVMRILIDSNREE